MVLAPSFNNAATLGGVLDRLQLLGLTVLVVNDGSTDGTGELLAGRVAEDSSGRLFTLAHPINRGKAAAMRSGFDWAAAHGFTHAITIDTDGQLDPADIPLLLEQSRQHPKAMVLGTRDAHAAGYPRASRLGRWAANTLIFWESGLRVPDSQCGLRVYPLEIFQHIDCHSGHFGFETEVLTRLSWANGKVRSVPVSCRYFPKESRVSHFRPTFDSLRMTPMHTRLMATTFRPFHMHRLAKSGESSGPSQCIYRRLMRWMNPLSAWKQLRGDSASRTRFAAGFAAGVFIANLPLYGVQTALSLLVARRLKLHPLSVVAGSNVSMPPIGPLLIAAAIAVGHFVTSGNWPVMADYNLHHVRVLSMLGPLLRDWAVGGAIVGMVLAGVAFVGLEGVFRFAAAAGRARSAAMMEAVK